MATGEQTNKPKTEIRKERLNKFLATNLGVSRREADAMIEAGKVKIDGADARLGARVDENNIVLVDEKPVRHEKLLYFALHKPTGYVCSRRRQGKTPTIYEILPENMQALKTVGRLDKDTSGLIILTNDGDFAFRMTHPKFTKEKTYEAVLDCDLEPLHQQMINDFGIQLPDGPSRLGLTRMDEETRRQWQIRMSEGRNRQIRRTFEALGYKVVRLHRTSFSKYTLGDLKPKEWREEKA